MNEILSGIFDSRKLKGAALGTAGIALAGGNVTVASIAAALAGLQILAQFLLDWKYGPKHMQGLATKPGYDPATQKVEE